jgi:SAM-dependent methyltransferase
MSLPPLTASGWLRWDVVQRLLPTSVTTVLEVGCGQGGFGARLSQGRDYLGVEPDAASSRTASSRLAELGRGEVRTGLVEDVLEPGRTFHLVCAFEVLEHVEDDDGVLASWVRRIEPGGWLLLSTPAYQARFGPSDEMVGHYRRYEPDQLAALLRSHGLQEVEVVVFGGPLSIALEKARNAIGRRRLQRRSSEPDRAPEAMRERTSGSGRLLQPAGAVGVVTRVGTKPFRLLQRRRPPSGVCLLARARRPVGGGGHVG